jgi:hypothetical protein
MGWVGYVAHVEAMKDICRVHKIIEKEPEIRIKIYIKETRSGPVASSCERSSKSEIFGFHKTRRTS